MVAFRVRLQAKYAGAAPHRVGMTVRGCRCGSGRQATGAAVCHRAWLSSAIHCTMSTQLGRD